MRSNPLKQRIAEGRTVFGTMAFEFFTPGFPAICRAAGAEFILYDMEHSGVSFETIKAQIACCSGLDIVPLVRVPSGDYHFIARALDIGAMGVMVPMVESAEQARAIVACTRYPGKGRRGAAFNVTPHDDYSPLSPAQKMDAANARTLVICLVETPRGIENVNEIAATDGVDIVWLGHFDLTSFMGIPAQFDHPRFIAAVAAITAACETNGKCAGYLAADERAARDFHARGFRALALGTDVTLLQGALAKEIKALTSLR
jgi:2-dehydro-3-deoxyglucarate aldolase/4-hydroxy-2-oxoheptanedioate aldolase